MFVDIEDSKFWFYIKNGISSSELLFDMIDNMSGSFLALLGLIVFYAWIGNNSRNHTETDYDWLKSQSN